MPSTAANRIVLTNHSNKLRVRLESSGSAITLTSGGSVLLPVHTHKSSTEGGDYGWADTSGSSGTGTSNYTARHDHYHAITILLDAKASGADGGTFTSGAWQTRTLNVASINQIGVTLSANQFTINDAGTYLIEWWAPAFMVGDHNARLYDVTGASVRDYGQNAYANHVAGYATSVSHGTKIVIIAASNEYRIEHRGSVTRATDGFGKANGFVGDSERYTQVKITKMRN
jgi:hypothetical protein